MTMARIPNATFAPEEGPQGPGQRLKLRAHAGEVLPGGMLLEFARPSVMHAYHEAGFDLLYLENEHMLFSPVQIVDTVAAARGLHLPAIAKISQLERDETTPLLGPGDFSVEMGRPGEADYPDVRGPMEEILALSKRRGVPFSTTPLSSQSAREWVAKGGSFFETGDELSLIYEGASQLVRESRMFENEAVARRNDASQTGRKSRRQTAR